MELSDILQVTDDFTEPRWVKYTEVPDGGGPAGTPKELKKFEVYFRLADLPGIESLALAAQTETRHRAPGGMSEEVARQAALDPGAVGRRLAMFAVIDWRGLTGKGLKYLAAGAKNLNVKAADGVEIPFSAALLETLVRWSGRFYPFVIRTWRELEVRQTAVREEEEKN